MNSRRVETYYDKRKRYTRVRPCPGQDVHSNWNVAFPRNLRHLFSLGQEFEVGLVECNNHYKAVGIIRAEENITQEEALMREIMGENRHNRFNSRGERV